MGRIDWRWDGGGWTGEQVIRKLLYLDSNGFVLFVRAWPPSQVDGFERPFRRAFALGSAMLSRA